jgi:hypothetical protein
MMAEIKPKYAADKQQEYAGYKSVLLYSAI